MRRTTVEELWEIAPNKYEAIVVVAKEARRIARWARERGIKLPKRTTTMAIERFLEGKVKYKMTKGKAEK